jgi:hypothetical protein
MALIASRSPLLKPPGPTPMASVAPALTMILSAFQLPVLPL